MMAGGPRLWLHLGSLGLAEQVAGAVRVSRTAAMGPLTSNMPTTAKSVHSRLVGGQGPGSGQGPPCPAGLLDQETSTVLSGHGTQWGGWFVAAVLFKIKRPFPCSSVLLFALERAPRREGDPKGTEPRGCLCPWPGSLTSMGLPQTEEGLKITVLFSLSQWLWLQPGMFPGPEWVPLPVTGTPKDRWQAGSLVQPPASHGDPSAAVLASKLCSLGGTSAISPMCHRTCSPRGTGPSALTWGGPRGQSLPPW